MYKNFLIILLLVYSLTGFSQNINGHITDEENNPLPAVNISIFNQSLGVTSDSNGKYNIEIPANRSVILVYSFIGFKKEKIRIPMLKKGQKYSLNIKLKPSSTLLNDVIITDQKSRKKSFSKIKPKHVRIIPGNSIGVEAVLKTLPE